jgi:hypothetical protein
MGDIGFESGGIVYFDCRHIELEFSFGEDSGIYREK